jgi:hypothetical protein
MSDPQRWGRATALPTTEQIDSVEHAALKAWNESRQFADVYCANAACTRTETQTTSLVRLCRSIS